jgi:hypothetical protein
MVQQDIDMQASPTKSLPTPSSCDWCLYPLILCPTHPSELVPYEPDPFWFYNEVIGGINSADAAETFRQIVELAAHAESGRSTFYNEVIDGVNSAGVGRGDSSTAQTFRQNLRRKTCSGRFRCSLCPAIYTARHNLQCTSHSAPPIIATTDRFTRPC